MKLSQTSVGTYLKAANFPDPVIWTIERIVTERTSESETRDKAVLYCEESEAGIVLNKGNTNVIVQQYGDVDLSTNEGQTEFSGQKIGIYTVDTELKGERVRGIRVKKPNKDKVQDEPDF